MVPVTNKEVIMEDIVPNIEYGELKFPVPVWQVPALQGLISKEEVKFMELALAIMMVLGIFVGIPAVIGFTIAGAYIWSDRRVRRATQTVEAHVKAMGGLLMVALINSLKGEIPLLPNKT